VFAETLASSEETEAIICSMYEVKEGMNKLQWREIINFTPLDTSKKTCPIE
jgi:hypothetical protein